MSQSARRKTSLLLVFVILVARGLEGERCLTIRGEAGTANITSGEICAWNGGLTWQRSLWPGSFGSVGDLVEVEERVDVRVVASCRRRGDGRVFGQCSHGDDYAVILFFRIDEDLTKANESG